MTRNALHFVLAAVLLAGAGQPVLAQTEPVTVSAPASQFERDRQSILAQVGNFHVRFDMRETVAFQPDYTPLEPKTSGGEEIVRVVYDEGDRISLQHILVMVHEGQSFVIKHWRQDWVYEPETVLTYAGADEWELTPVSVEDRQGAWSQTVWQTDDSPRYGGVGHWTYTNGLTEWTSAPSWRPLARRDAVRSPVYDRYLGVNRHALTPTGWVHIQDNLKMATAEGSEGEPAVVVHEDVVNTYRRSDDFDVTPGETYWTNTQAYWAEVRKAWDEAIVAGNGVHVQEQAQNGSVTGSALMGLADELNDGEITLETAVSDARETIRNGTTRN